MGEGCGSGVDEDPQSVVGGLTAIVTKYGHQISREGEKSVVQGKTKEIANKQLGLKKKNDYKN